MTESTRAVQIRPVAPLPAQLDIMTLGNVLAQSGYFTGAKEAAQAVVKVLAGQELGFGPIASMMGVYIIEGKPSYASNLIAAAIQRSQRYGYRILQLDNTRCSLAFMQDGAQLGVETFTIDDAKAAELTSKPIWRRYPKNLLFARALTNGARFYCPEVFSGVPIYTPEELGADVDEDGTPVRVAEAPRPTSAKRDVIDAEPQPWAERIQQQMKRQPERTDVVPATGEIIDQAAPPTAGVSDPDAERKAFVKHWRGQWFVAVKGTMLDSDDARHAFIEQYTDGETASLTTFLEREGMVAKDVENLLWAASTVISGKAKADDRPNDGQLKAIRDYAARVGEDPEPLIADLQSKADAAALIKRLGDQLKAPAGR